MKKQEPVLNGQWHLKTKEDWVFFQPVALQLKTVGLIIVFPAVPDSSLSVTFVMNKNKMDALSFKLETIFAQNAAVIIS